MKPAISLEGVSFEYGGSPVLAGLDLAAEKGEVLTLLGPSGCGKSTVLRLILGLAVPKEGSVWLDGALASSSNRLVIAPEKRGLAVVFQDLALWPHLTVAGNLRFGLAARRTCASEREARIAAILKRLGLEEKAARYPGELSGGERQRVAIARALVLEPRAVLLDEPLSNLDVALKRDLLVLFVQLFGELQSTVVFVTHDIREAVALGGRIAIMDSGRIAQTGTINELRERPISPLVGVLVEDLDWESPRAPVGTEGDRCGG